MDKENNKGKAYLTWPTPSQMTIDENELVFTLVYQILPQLISLLLGLVLAIQVSHVLGKNSLRATFCFHRSSGATYRAKRMKSEKETEGVSVPAFLLLFLLLLPSGARYVIGAV